MSESYDFSGRIHRNPVVNGRYEKDFQVSGISNSVETLQQN